MSDIRRLALYFVGVLVLGALLAPWLWWGGHWLAGQAAAFAFLEKVTFTRYFNRAMLVAAIALLWPLARSLRVRSVAELGLQPNPRWSRDLLLGAGLALASVGAMWLVLWLGGFHELKPERRIGIIGQALATAVTVSLLEEALFRGGMLGAVRRTASLWPAQLFLAALFAIVHFLKPPADRAAVEALLGPIHFFSGFELLPHIAWQFQQPWLVLGGFLTLFVVGLILGLAREDTRSLWLPIGLHFGWVLGLKLFSGWMMPTQANQLPWIGQDLLVGLIPLALIIATGFIVRRASRG
ncbi:MAG: CPBP family intramembrane metalloprotease [Verrucomicrobia bacterium]|nr:CPBP family intramembrane metalloprotease [Verrucomicrobiota bacterium]